MSDYAVPPQTAPSADNESQAAALPFPPRGYIIGAQKAGTTTLAFLLDQHPGITLSTPKEPDFFTRHWPNGLDWYRGCFGGDAGFLIDASTSYSMAPDRAAAAPDRAASGDDFEPLAGVPERIRSLRPDARFVYILRNPVERTYSAYWHSVRAGEEKRPLAQVLQDGAYYLQPSRYHFQIARYLEHFDIEAFHFIRFDTLTADPVAAARGCLAFFGVTPADFAFVLEAPKNQSFQYNRLGRLMRVAVGSEQRLKAVAQTVRNVVPDALHPLIKSAVSKGIPEITDADRRLLEDYFAAENDKLEQLTGIRF